MNRVTKLAVALVLATGCAVAEDKNATPAKDGGVKLFADADWYRQQPGKEEVFRGRLEAVQPQQASSLMRSALYRLAKRSIYTGGQKVVALDKRVGSEIEIHGKAVDMDLEGQSIREIWPASVRTVNGQNNSVKR